ncbi:MAG: hypothetical protein LBT41_06250, partial [Candidatus Methanoplasma sp.]|nr:hypothetical protein [Candidatus Methanoplasma sp.]
MILERLAESISKHAKLVIVLWVMALILASPFISKVSDSLDYGMDSMSSSDSESVKGMEILNSYFATGANSEEMFILAVEFKSPEGAAAAAALGKKLIENLDSFVDGNGKVKITAVSEGGVFTDSEGMAGIILYAMRYDSSYTAGFISGDTGNLRNFISDTAS